jgi:ABC-2 type transport system permease protein
VITASRHTWYLSARLLRNLSRQPAWIVISLIQPLIYLLIFAPAFRSVVQIPGFGGGSYVDYLVPGIVVMTVLFSGGWAGMGVIEDMDRGIMDRLLVTPVSRTAIICGRLLQGALLAVVQAGIIIVIGLLVGADYPGGLLGMAVLLGASIFLGEGFAALSTGVALLARKEDTLIAAANMLLTPLMFLSAVFMRIELMPHWIQTAARYNPVNWAVAAGREAMQASVDWNAVLRHAGYLLAFAAVCALLATRAFRAYQRAA